MSNLLQTAPLVPAVTRRWFQVLHHPTLVLEIATTKDEEYEAALAASGVDPNRLQATLTRAMVRATLSGTNLRHDGFRQSKRKTNAEMALEEERRKSRMEEALEETLTSEATGFGIEAEKLKGPVAHLVKDWAHEEVDGERRPVTDSNGNPLPCNVETVTMELLTDPEAEAKRIPKTIEIDGTVYVNAYAGLLWSEANARMIHAFALEVDAGAVEDVGELGKSSAGGPNTTSASTPSSTPTSETAATGS